MAGQRPPPPRPPPRPEKKDLTIEELLLEYWRHAEKYYVKYGAPTSEADTIRQALRFVRRLYGNTLAKDFSTEHLEAVRQAMIDHRVTRKVKVKDRATGAYREEVRVEKKGLARTFINKQVARIRRLFRWAVVKKHVPAEAASALEKLPPLQRGKSDAREKAKVRPVDGADVRAVLPHLPPTVRTMVQVQRLCGGRPQDVVEMRPCDIDRRGSVWEYRPARHKCEHKDMERVVFLGPKAQELLLPYLEGIGPEEHVFSPRRSEQARLAELRRRRGQPERKPEKDRGKWALRDQYDADSYRRAVRRACQKAGVPIWSPMQLRHATATAVRDRFGLEAAQVVLGHAELGVTQVYAEKDLKLGREVMAEIG